jgi:hypothetical protein
MGFLYIIVQVRLKKAASQAGEIEKVDERVICRASGLSLPPAT